MGRRLGLIIGINSYRDTTFRPLQYAEMDARGLAQWLVNTKGGNWAPADVQLVQGAYATSELIESLAIQMCVNNVGPGDLVFVYFAGHAFLDEATGEGYLALANTRYQQPTTGLHLASLVQKTMSHSRAAHIVFLLDCFQSGAAWDKYRSSPYDSKPLLGSTLANTLQQIGNRMILSSCRGNELVPESGAKNLGTFAYRMIVGLCNPPSDSTTKQITLQRLNTYLSNSLGEQHRPQFFGQEQTPTILVGDMPEPFSPKQTGTLFPQPSGPLASPFSPSPLSSSPTQSAGVLQSQASSYATATAQLSPTTSGQLAISEQQSATLLRQARHLLQLQNLGEAFNLVEQALHITPLYIEALILKGQLLGTVGRFQEALYVVEQILQLNPNHALVWSMRAALLTNIGQYQFALQAVERSLQLDPNNPETYTIKTSIMSQIASEQNQKNNQKSASVKKRGGPVSFFIGTAIQLFGLILGVVGTSLPILQPRLPVVVAFVLQSIGLALLCVNAARSSYLYGFTRFLLTLFTSLLTVAILGGIYLFGRTHLTTMVVANPLLLIPILFLASWLAIAAAVPLLLALVGFIVGLIIRVRKKKQLR